MMQLSVLPWSLLAPSCNLGHWDKYKQTIILCYDVLVSYNAHAMRQFVKNELVIMLML